MSKGHLRANDQERRQMCYRRLQTNLSLFIFSAEGYFEGLVGQLERDVATSSCDLIASAMDWVMIQ